FATQQPQAQTGLQPRRHDRQVPHVLDPEAGTRREPDHRHRIGEEAHERAQQHRAGVAEALEHAVAGKDQPLRHQIHGHEVQELGGDRHGLAIVREAVEQQPRLPLREDRDRDHDDGADRHRLDEGLPHAPGIACAEILTGDRAGSERDRQCRHLDQTEHARPDAEAGLGRRAEIA
ncbi:hypothetical protein chiPu_0033474, partial [Chiloscyllium punctatum]|nr:hypothetical protein [Chiloscyllium punctatum]